MSTPHQCEYRPLGTDKVRTTKTIFKGTCKVCRGKFIFKFSRYDPKVERLGLPRFASDPYGYASSSAGSASNPTHVGMCETPRPPSSIPLNLCRMDAECVHSTLQVPNIEQLGNDWARRMHEQHISPFVMYACGSRVVDLYSLPIAGSPGASPPPPPPSQSSNHTAGRPPNIPLRPDRYRYLHRAAERGRPGDGNGNGAEKNRREWWPTIGAALNTRPMPASTVVGVPKLLGIEFTLPFVYYLHPEINTLADWIKAAGHGRRLGARSLQDLTLSPYNRAALQCFHNATDPHFVRRFLWQLEYLITTWHEATGSKHQDVSVANVIATTPDLLRMVDSRRWCHLTPRSPCLSNHTSPHAPHNPPYPVPNAHPPHTRAGHGGGSRHGQLSSACSSPSSPPPRFDIQSEECFQFGSCKFVVQQDLVPMLFDFGCMEAPGVPNPQSYMAHNLDYGLGLDEPLYDHHYLLNSLVTMLEHQKIYWDQLDSALKEFLGDVLPIQVRGAGRTRTPAKLPGLGAAGAGAGASGAGRRGTGRGDAAPGNPPQAGVAPGGAVPTTSTHVTPTLPPSSSGLVSDSPCFDHRLVKMYETAAPMFDVRRVLYHKYFEPLRVYDDRPAKYSCMPQAKRFLPGAPLVGQPKSQRQSDDPGRFAPPQSGRYH